ncbi:hypothetical protein JCM3765_000960 [Sporobolomyces pararoseus]
MRLLQILEDQPSFRSFVKEWDLFIEEKLHDKDTVHRLISSLPNLQLLKIKLGPQNWLSQNEREAARADRLDQDSADRLIKVIPSSLKYLDISEAGLSTDNILALFVKTPHLETFAYDPYGETSPIAELDSCPALPNLRNLVLGSDALRQSAFLALTSSTTLTSLDIDFISVPDIPSASASTLRFLKIRTICQRDASNHEIEIASHLATIFPNCHSLLSLEMEGYHRCDSLLFFITFTSLGGLHLLPSFPRRLVLSSCGLSTSHLLDYLSRSLHYYLDLSVTNPAGERKRDL